MNFATLRARFAEGLVVLRIVSAPWRKQNANTAALRPLRMGMWFVEDALVGILCQRETTGAHTVCSWLYGLIPTNWACTWAALTKKAGSAQARFS